MVLARLAPRTREARVVPADLRPALLPEVAVAEPVPIASGGIPDQVRAGRRVAPRAGAIAPGHKHLGVFDGGYALRSVVRPLVLPAGGGAGIDFLTRLRHDARLFTLPPPRSPRRDPGAVAEVGPAAGAAPPRRPVGGGGGPAPPSSTAGSGRSAGRRSSACGGCWAGRCRSRRSSRKSRGIRSGSPW